MSDIVIKAEHISKKFCKSLRYVMAYGAADITRDFFSIKSKTEELRNGEFSAVDDVSFELKRGETLGIIGPNGSGKSTVLKMLNGIYMPDKGRLQITGRVGALIEVGAGFHPMLTGRENIYVNGAILGLSKREIGKKFDEIVDFAGIGDFLDSPVKHYSSGMFVRLGFAVAVHCEPDILLVDEVLAVGDGAFKNKCYRKMNEIKHTKNMAIVFVSHDLFTVEKFCEESIFLNSGIIESFGNVQKVVVDYQKLITQLLDKQKLQKEDPASKITNNTKKIIRNITLLGQNNIEKKEFNLGDSFGIKIEYETENPINNPQIEISLFNKDGIKVCSLDTMADNTQALPIIHGKGSIECWVGNLPLLANNYYLYVHLYDSNHIYLFDYWDGTTKSNLNFTVLPNRISAIMGDYRGICHFPAKWSIK